MVLAITKVSNLICSLFGSVVYVSALAERAEHLTASSVLMTLIQVAWFVSAVGLFLRSGWAWWGSVVGAGAMFAFSTRMLLVCLVLSPIAQDPSDGIGFGIIIGMVGVIISLPLLVGLANLRRQRESSKCRLSNRVVQMTE